MFQETLASLDGLIAQLADMLGATIEMIKDQGMDYVVMYGRYALVQEVFGKLIGGTMIGMVIWAIVSALTTVEATNMEEASKKFKKNFKWGVKYVYIFAFVLASKAIALYFISPEVYSILKVIDLLQGNDGSCGGG